MDIAEALTVLGLGPDPTWAEVRHAHRSAIRKAHPDITGGSTSSAARINEAFDRLRAATGDGAEPFTAVATSPAASPRPTVSSAAHAWPGEDPVELLFRLAEAGDAIGEVVFVDPDGGLLEIVVGRESAVGQLAVSVGRGGPDGLPVSFTLEPLGVTPAPPIRSVVDQLMALLDYNHEARGSDSGGRA